MRWFLSRGVAALSLVLAASCVPAPFSQGSSSSGGHQSNSQAQDSSSASQQTTSQIIPVSGSSAAPSSSGVGSTSLSTSLVVSSSFAQGSSTSTASSGAIPLDQLCPALAQGAVRALTWQHLDWEHHCPTAFTREGDAYLNMVGDRQGWVDQMCSPDGLIFREVQRVAHSQTAGYVRYNENQAGECLKAGKDARRFLEGVLQVDGTEDGGTPWLQAACQGILTPLEDINQPCNEDHDCIPQDGGVQCFRSAEHQCQGRCTYLGLEGERCGERFPRCRPPLYCLHPEANEPGTCARPQPPRTSCVSDAGQLQCMEGSACVDGVCLLRRGEGLPCANTAECRPGLYCSQLSKCTAPASQGGPCEVNQSSCQPCLTCVARGDGGAPTCQAGAAVDESCVTRPCLPGLYCANNACKPLVGSGQPCVITRNDPAPRLQGNCLNPDEACIGTPPTCQPRATEGQACQPQGSGEANQGSCATSMGLVLPLYCLRVEEASLRYQCTRPPQPGEPCGKAEDLHPYCSGVDGGSASCTVGPSGLGICSGWPGSAEGQGCMGTSQCQSGLYCKSADGGFPGTCVRGGLLGESCERTTPHANRCFEGYCASTGPDAGNLHRCSPFLPIGTPCTTASQCEPGTICLAFATMQVCSARLGQGIPCTSNNMCADGLRCVDGVCTPLACTATAETVEGCSRSSLLPSALFFGLVVGWRARRSRPRT